MWPNPQQTVQWIVIMWDFFCEILKYGLFKTSANFCNLKYLKCNISGFQVFKFKFCFIHKFIILLEQWLKKGFFWIIWLKNETAIAK